MNTEASFQQKEHSALEQDPKLKELEFRLWNLPRVPFLALILLYQKTLSKALPQNTCRYHPSCSHYAYQAIYKYGLFKGSFMAGWRILRCNPFSKGGFDPVP